ncbi:MAG: type III pantothenate kinase [Marivirga sp.]|jgi:type III pantothenate kinase
MNAAIDVGNTLVKVGVFKKDKMIEQHSFTSLQMLKKRIDLSSFEKLIVASVNQPYDEINDALQLPASTYYLTTNTSLPFFNHYASNSLGIDRIALAAGANKLFPNQNNLIIDMGTCITYDLVNKDNEYIGGAISPGVNMRFKSLHTFTARLPLIPSEPLHEVDIGNTTEDSIMSGVTNGVVGELEYFISKFENKFGDINIILCGGNANFFESKIKATIFAIPQLLLEGLNAILKHNASI